MSISLNAVTPSGLRARSARKERERLEKLGEQRIVGVKADIERLAYDIFINYIEKCQGSQFERRWAVAVIDVRAWLRHYFNPRGGEDQKGQMETQVRVYARELHETYALTFSLRAITITESSGWLHGCRLT
jgi:hypothetical protein